MDIRKYSLSALTERLQKSIKNKPALYDNFRSFRFVSIQPVDGNVIKVPTIIVEESKTLSNLVSDFDNITEVIPLNYSTLTIKNMTSLLYWPDPECFLLKIPLNDMYPIIRCIEDLDITDDMKNSIFSSFYSILKKQTISTLLMIHFVY